MKQTVHESILNMEKVFLAKNMPLGVAVAFTRLVCNAAGITEGLAVCQCQEADNVAKLQNNTGTAHIPQERINPSIKKTSPPLSCWKF